MLCIVVKFILTLMLLVISALISKDVLDQYASKSTSFKQFERAITQNETATLVLGFWPLKRMDYPTSVPFQLYEQWKIGQDFKLSFGVVKYRTIQESINFISENEDGNISHSSVGIVKLRKLIGTWGNFYKISANINNIKAPYRAFLNINLDTDIASDDIPMVDVFLSSEENSFGISMGDWLDGKRLILTKLQGFRQIEVQPKKVIKNNAQCSHYGFYNCFHSELSNHKYEKCPKKCFSISTYLNATPICETLNEFQCSHEKTQELKDGSKCLPACHQTHFTLEYDYQEDQDEPNANRNVTLAYRIANSKIKVEEEYLVQDFVGMLGSIGGTLGLFIGFSFLGGSSYFLEHLQIFMQGFIAKISSYRLKESTSLNKVNKSSRK